MQGFIFGAGFGVRLRPLTDYRPKVTVPVLGKPIIFYVIDRLEQLSVSSVIINTHYKPDILKNIVDNGYQCDEKIFYSDEPVILETGGGLFNARDLISDQSVIVYNGDIYTDFNLNKMIEFHKKKKAVATLAVASWCQPRQISLNSDKKITDIRRIYTSSLPTHTFMGIHIIEKDFLSELALEARKNRAFSIIKTYLRLIREKKPIFAYE
ncbi:nucleotidyltransferase family protein, partial [bacterium]|nr:nucleotidyltransferase family protein [bacterium]